MYDAAKKKKKKSRGKLNLTLFSFYGPLKEKVVCMYNPTFWTLWVVFFSCVFIILVCGYICLVSFRNVTTNARLLRCIFFTLFSAFFISTIFKHVLESRLLSQLTIAVYLLPFLLQRQFVSRQNCFVFLARSPHRGWGRNGTRTLLPFSG